jgi:serine-threonine kinase receptor-associated protein
MVAGRRMWDVRQGKAVRQIDTSAVVTSIEVSQDGRHVTTADGQDVRIWDGTTLEPVKSFKVGIAAHGMATVCL